MDQIDVYNFITSGLNDVVVFLRNSKLRRIGGLFLKKRKVKKRKESTQY
jgi:hypothetical protein